MSDLAKFPFVNQALLGQQHRLLKLTSPLGPDVLLPQRVVAHEQLGRAYDYTVDCVAISSDIDLKKLIAKPITLWVQQVDRAYLPVHGFVHTAKRLGSDGQVMLCQLSLAPWLYFLKFRRNARIWQDKSADDILCDVFDSHQEGQGNYRFELQEPAVVRSYCTQYESDWNFVHRLMEEEGWFCYHEQEPDGTRHVLVITDSTFNTKPIAQQTIQFHGAGTEDELNKILHWGASRYAGPSQYSASTDDYKAPRVAKQTNTAVQADHGDLPGQLEIYEYTGAYTYAEAKQGDKQARLRVEQWESSMKRFSGVSGVRFLPVGTWFELEDHPVHQYDTPEDREFIVTSVTWCIENNLPLSRKAKDFPGSLVPQVEAFKRGVRRHSAHFAERIDAEDGQDLTGHCFNHFEVQRRKVPFRSAFDHQKPTLHPQTAVVVGPVGEEIYTDHLNRVKVLFRWDRLNPGDETASCWVRVSYPNAGQGWGALHVPRVGQEVIITFLDGDANRPVVTGRLYNDDQAPHWHTNGKLSGYKSKEYKGLGYNQLVFDDTTNQNRVHLYSTNTNAQLNLGYLVGQTGNERKQFYGSGFSLSTDHYGAIVADRGLYLSTFGRLGPHGSQLDATEATAQLRSGAALTKSLSDTATKAGAEPLAGQEALEQFADSSVETHSGDGPGQGEANQFKEPILLAGSPAGIGLASSKGVHAHAGAEVTVSSGTDMNVATGRSLLASIKEKISLFAYNAGIKIFAAKGKVEVQAQSNDLDLIAEKVVRLLSTTSRVEIHAKEEVMISAGGSFIKINASGITNGTSGTWTAKASMHTMPGPGTQNFAMPEMPVSELTPNKLVLERLYHDNEPLVGAAFEAVFPNGEVRKGTLDGAGRATLTGVPAGTAEVRFGPMPGQYARKDTEPTPNYNPNPTESDIDALIDKYAKTKS